MANREEECLSRRAKLLYGIGDTGFSLTSTIMGQAPGRANGCPHLPPVPGISASSIAGT
jgi:hypothetical protein